MPKKYGVKEKDLVVSHVVNLVLTGKLRSGDRIDRNEIAHELVGRRLLLVHRVGEVAGAHAEVRETFKVPRVGVVAGCYVRSGLINRQGRVHAAQDRGVTFLNDG